MSWPVRRRRFRTPLAVVGLLLALGVAMRAGMARFEPPPPASEPLAEATYAVRRVVDGDTLLLKDGRYVRLIGVDTPETKKENHSVEPFGPEATQFTENFIRGKPVLFRLDHERLDQHGRTLAYVYVDGKMLNEELLRVGLARARTRFNYAESMKKKFRAAENEARQNRRGIWSQGM